jgi:hypothetical protein
MSEEQTNPAAERIKERKKNSVEPESFLKDAGAIKTTETKRKLAFTGSFAAKLADAVDEVQHEGIGVAELAQLFGVSESEVLEKDREYSSWRIRNVVYNWPSEGALVFDIATDRTLRDVADDWDGVPPKQRFMIAQSLRSFQDECIFCGGEIVFNDNPVRSCCSDRRVLTFHCGSCERRYLEFTTEDDQRQQIRSGT